MNDDLNVILKAKLDIDKTSKEINIQLDQLEDKCKELGIDINLDNIFKGFNDAFNKVKKSTEQIANSLKNVDIGDKFSKGFTELNAKVKEIKNSVKELSNVTTSIRTDADGNIEKAIISYEEMGNAVETTMGWVKRLNEEGEEVNIFEVLKHNFDDKKVNTFNDSIEKTRQQLSKLSSDINIKSDSALWNFTDKLDEQSFTGLKSGINTVKAELLALSKIDIIDETSLKEVKNRMSEISNEYDSIIKNAQLDKKVNDYINQQKKEQSNLADYIEKKQREIYLLEEKILNLNKTKGLNTSVYSNNFEELKTLLSDFGQGDIPLDDQKKKIENIIVLIKDLVNTNSKDLDLLYKKEDLYEKINSQIKSFESLKSNYDISDSFKLNIDDEIEKLNKLKIEIEKETMSTKEATIETKKFDTSLKGMTTQAKSTSDATAKLGDRLKKAFQYFTFYDALNLAKRGFREMVGVIFELDDALVEIQKVSNLSGKSLESFTRQAYSLGAEISKSGKQVIEASTQFARAGFDESELLSLAETALKLTSIGDGLTNVSESANTLIAVMRGFGKGTDEVVSIMDAINNVSNNASVNFNDVTMALQRMSGTMNASGIDLQKSIGLFTALNEVLRNTEMSSTAINSISMRMRGLSEDGEAIDGLSPKLQKMFKDIAGIDITDSTGQVEDLYTILGKLSPVWDTLTKNQKQYIAQESSGIRQAKSFLILMDNYNRVLETTDLAYNSAGSSAEEFARWQDSLEGKLNNLKSAIEQFSSETIDSQFTKSILDATTSIVNMGTAMGGAIPVILALSGAFATFKLITFAGGISGITTAIGVLGLSISGLLPIIGLAVGVGGAIAGVATVINEVKNASKNAKAEVEALSSELKELQNNSESIGSLSKKYIELRGIKDADKTSEQWREYYNVQNQLHELLPDLNGYINEQGNFIIENVEAVSDLTDVYKEYIAEKRKERAEASKESAKYTLKQYDEEKKKLEELTEYHNLRNAYLSGKLSKEDSGRYGQLGYRYGGLKDLEAEIKSVQSTVNELSNSIEADVSNIVKATDGWGKLTEDQANAVNRAFATLSEGEQKKWLKQLSDQTLTEEELNKVTQEFIDTLIQTYPALEYLSNALKKTEDSADGTNEAVKSLEESLKSLTSTRSDIESLSNILNNLNEGSFTASDMEALLSVSEEFLPYLNDEIALREKLNEVIAESKSTYQATYEYMILLSSDTYKTLTNRIEDYFNGLGVAYKDDLKNYKDLEMAKATISNNLIGQLAKKWGDYFSVGLNGVVQVDDTKANVSSRVLEKQYKEAQSYVDGFYNLFNDIEIDPIDINFDTSSLKSSADKAISEVDRLKQELEKRLQDNEFKLSLLEFSGGEDTLTKQIAVYRQMQDAVHTLAEKYRSMGLSENDDYIQQLRTQWMDYANTISSLEATSFDNSNKDIDRNITQLELQQQLLKENSQEYIDIENKKYDEIVKRERLLQTEIARLQAIGTAQAKEQAESLIDTYYDTVSQRYNIIANLQSSQISIYNEQIKTLEKQKDALSNLHKYTMQMIKDELNAKKKSIQDELKGIEAVFDAKKKALRDEKDSRNYEKGLTEKSSLVADLENQLAIIKNDETAIAKRKKLEEELAKAKEDLADYQYEHSIDLQEKSLDSELEKVKETYEDRIEELDSTLSNEVKMRELADKRIEKSGEKLYKELINYSKEYGSITEDEIKNAWDNANISMQGYKDTQEDVLETLKRVTEELSKIENLNISDYSNKIGTSTSYNGSAETTKAKMMANSAKWLGADATTRDDLARKNQELGNSMGWTYDPVQGRWFYDKDKKLPVYHSGGIVGGNSYATKSTEELAKLLKGELVITPPQASKVMDMITNNNNSNSFAPTFMFNFEGTPNESLLEQFEKHAKEMANMVAKEFNKTRANTGWKKPVKSF